MREKSKCNYRRGCNRFQVGHGFSNILDSLLKIKVLIENFLSLQEHEIEDRVQPRHFKKETSYDPKEFPTMDLRNKCHTELNTKR